MLLSKRYNYIIGITELLGLGLFCRDVNHYATLILHGGGGGGGGGYTDMLYLVSA